MNLSRRETELIVEELDRLVVPSRVQKIFEASPRTLVFQLRVPGQTHHLLISAEPDDTRIHLVDSKPRQPDHPSPFTMQARKWLHGAWIDTLTVRSEDRIVDITLEAIEPEWEPTSEDEKAPRITVSFVAELLGRHPNLFLLDADHHIIGTGPGRVLGDRPVDIDDTYQTPPPPPEWADDDQVRPALQSVSPDGSRSRAVELDFSQSLEEKKRSDLERTLKSRLKSRHKRLRRRVGHIESDLERIDDATEYRRYGELLQAAYGDVEPGATSVSVPDYYQEGMPEIEISLDPSMSLQDNIDRYFHEYRRLTGARQKVETRLLKTMEAIDEVDEARKRLEELEEIEALEAFRDELLESGVIKRRGRGGPSGSKRDKPLPPYREFKAHSGAAILVGRNARANDTLTTSVARGRDMWLHARDWQGSHVVLRMRKNQEIHSEDLIDAAILAAHFSRGRRDTVVDVTYTEAKHVRKPPNSAPGLVTVGGGSNLAVRIEAERLERLLDSEVQL